MNDLGYAGDITPTETWERLAAIQTTRLLDVRTPAEWAYVGLPDLTGLGKQPLLVPWMMFPAMQVNVDFVRQVTDLGVDKDADLLIICRSGQRSAAAAMTLTESGFKACYNVSTGFEGDKDAGGHRGTVNGWKFDGLSWVQG